MSNPLKSVTPSPPLSFCTSDDMKSYNDSVSQEVKSSRAQVEELSCKTQLLEYELHEKSKQLNEITLRVEDKVCKNKAAEELIKSLTSQLKEMAESEQQITCRNLDTNDQITCETNRPSNGSSQASITSPKSECGDNPTPPPMSNGTKSSQIHKSEHMIQDEPKVYITLISLPDCVNELRRIRFR